MKLDDVTDLLNSSSLSLSKKHATSGLEENYSRLCVEFVEFDG